MLARSLSAGLVGIDARQVEIEIDIVRGLPGFAIVGLPDAAIRESKDRIRSAIENSCYEFPPKNFVANLAPAFFKKEGSNFDLSIAAAILHSTGQIDSDPSSIPMIGELSLDGSVKPVRGILSMVLALLRAGHSRVIVPYENRIEACAISQIEIFPVKNLHEMTQALAGRISPCKESDAPNEEEIFHADFAHVYGQESVKRAIEIAAAGHHNILLYGPPGSGKSLVARCMPSILPRLTREESLETTMIHSVSGTLDTSRGLLRSPPFRAPHHTVSYSGAP